MWCKANLQILKAPSSFINGYLTCGELFHVEQDFLPMHSCKCSHERRGCLPSGVIWAWCSCSWPTLHVWYMSGEVRECEQREGWFCLHCSSYSSLCMHRSHVTTCAWVQKGNIPRAPSQTGFQEMLMRHYNMTCFFILEGWGHSGGCRKGVGS